MNTLSDEKIIESWSKNAHPWTTAVRAGSIESRRRVTDRAILEAVLARSPHRVLDIGCGEGWLLRALAERGIRGIGIDAVPALIEAARAAGDGEFHLMSYAELAGAPFAPADALVCNFSLLGEDAAEAVFRAAAALLKPHGSLIVQTLHPVAACGGLPYRNGWRQGSWAGCGKGFGKPAPWYFRTLGSWVALFADHGLRLAEMREPLHPDTGEPASVILIGRLPG